MAKKLPNIHPGEILVEEFLLPLELSQNALARALGVPPRRINEIVLGKRAVTADTALRLARYFGNTPGFWMALQAAYDLEEAQDALGRQLERKSSLERPESRLSTPQIRANITRSTTESAMLFLADDFAFTSNVKFNQILSFDRHP